MEHMKKPFYNPTQHAKNINKNTSHRPLLPWAPRSRSDATSSSLRGRAPGPLGMVICASRPTPVHFVGRNLAADRRGERDGPNGKGPR